MATCPAEVQTAINAIFADATDLDPFTVTDEANSCLLSFNTSTVGVFNGLSDDNGGVVGTTINGEAFPLIGPDMPGSLSLEEVDACALAIGQCNNFNDLLPQP